MCAHAVRVALHNIPGVDSVHVSLNDGYAQIVLAPDNQVTVERVRAVIRDNGFTPREARVVVRGRVTHRDRLLVLETPAGETFGLAATEVTLQRLRAAADDVTLRGTVTETAKRAAGPPMLQVEERRDGTG